MAPDRFKGLVEAARRGDQAAWSEIYGELAPAVLGYLRGSGTPDPEDTCAEAFLQVARDLESFSGDWGAFRGWVFAVAYHRLLDARRHSARRPTELMAQPPEPTTEPIPDAADEALARISYEEVRRLLDELSEDQRSVLLLRILGDLSIEQVARALGKRPGAIKQLQRRGLAAVRRARARKGVTV
jgi:RNA polymerase sigma-70 factor (ECF subfamily)